MKSCEKCGMLIATEPEEMIAGQMCACPQDKSGVVSQLEKLKEQQARIDFLEKKDIELDKLAQVWKDKIKEREELIGELVEALRELKSESWRIGVEQLMYSGNPVVKKVNLLLSKAASVMK